MAVSVELGKALDNAPEHASLEEVLAALTEKHNEILTGMGTNSIRDQGSNKHFAVAGVLVALSGKAG